MNVIPDPPTTEEMLKSPKPGDILCYNGIRWCVARRDGWHYPVEEEKPIENCGA